jgi:hypothetical protein
MLTVAIDPIKRRFMRFCSASILYWINLTQFLIHKTSRCCFDFCENTESELFLRLLA